MISPGELPVEEWGTVEDISKVTSRRTVLQAIGSVGAVVTGGTLVGAAQRSESNGTGNAGGQSGETDRLIVGVSDERPMAAVAEDVRSIPDGPTAVSHRNEALGYVTVELPAQADNQARNARRQAIEERPGVEYVERDETYQTQMTPNDPQFGSQHAPAQINAPAAWDTTTGSQDVTLAVIDTGTQYDHPDLAPQFGDSVGTDLDDGDGDPAPDYSFESHGTHVSGLAAAATNNARGVAGVSDSRLLSVRAMSSLGLGTTTNIVDGIQWATDQGADVINLSLGGRCDPNNGERRAVRRRP